jgi:hypothetical protein
MPAANASSMTKPTRVQRDPFSHFIVCLLAAQARHGARGVRAAYCNAARLPCDETLK